MSTFVPGKRHLREVLLHYFFLKKSAAESRRMLVEAYNDHAPSVSMCEKWFQRFRDNDFDLDDKEHGRPPKKVEDAQLEALLDDDACQTEVELATSLQVTQQCISLRLRAMGLVQKQGYWVPHRLTDRDIERRRTTCEMLLQRHRRKGFLHRIVTGDEKWIHYDNPKRRAAWVRPGEPGPSTPKRDIHGSKVMLCIWWDMKGVVYYELLQPSETITGARYRLQLLRLNRALKERRPEWGTRHDKIILQHDNARPHVHRSVKTYLEGVNWEVLPHPPYSPDIAPSDYYLFRSMASALSGERFGSREGIRMWLDNWIASKQPDFYRRGIRLLPERWDKVVGSDGAYFE